MSDHLSATLQATLEALAEVCDDLAPPVYARFFETHPAARNMFRLDARTRGRMLNEVLTLLLETARHEGYMRATVEGLAKDHESYGHIPPALYRGFLDALLATMADLLKMGWTVETDAAWRAQADRLLELIAESRLAPQLT